MVSVWREGGADVVASSVTDFTAVMGYCEFEAPMLLEKVRAEPSAAAVEGAALHRAEEEYEQEHVELVPVTAEQVADASHDVEFPREEMRTRLVSRTRVGGRDAEVRLYGRTDKMLRKGRVLTVEDDKFVVSPRAYAARDRPYPDQMMQVLAYLNSSYSRGGDDWFDVDHDSKAWAVHIRDKRGGGRVVKSFSGEQTLEDLAFLNRSVERFAALLTGAGEPEHHNNPRKCAACKFLERCPARVVA